MRRLLAVLSIAGCGLAALGLAAGGQELEGLGPPSRLPSPGEGQELVGTPAPDWGRLEWVELKGRLRLEDLRGRVVLVRWWTDGCLYCVDSAPVLRRLYDAYRDRGLVVIGMYHPKPPRRVPAENVREMSTLLGFGFPVALDSKWKALRKWWLKDHDRAFTFVSFLIDPEGVIRWVHPGGTYSLKDEAELEKRIVELLEPPRPPAPKS